MKDFLKKLGIEGDLVESSGGLYTLDIADSDEYGRIYSKLDKSPYLEELGDNSQITYSTASIQFDSDDYRITLLADFDADTYKMTIKEI